MLPGLIHCHTHLLARIPDTPEGYALNLLTKSQAFRALEGAFDARVTLHAGYTTVRDVENEGSGYADVALRDAINQGLVEGPRMQVATRGIAALGRYFPFRISSDLENFPTGAEMISGPEEARRAVREQLGHGADLIKVYADWGRPTLALEELRMVVEEAHKAGRRVAAHADSSEGSRNALTAGVDSIEHGHESDRQAIEMMKQKGAFYVPTVGVLAASYQSETDSDAKKWLRKRMDSSRNAVLMARELGVKIAAGYDAGSAAEQGHNARELLTLNSYGLSPLEVIRAATASAAELLGWEDRVGSVEPGKFADLIAVGGDPLTDIGELDRIEFVMKGGAVVKDDVHRR